MNPRVAFIAVPILAVIAVNVGVSAFNSAFRPNDQGTPFLWAYVLAVGLVFWVVIRQEGAARPRPARRALGAAAITLALGVLEVAALIAACASTACTE